MDCANNDVSLHYEGIDYFVLANEIMLPLSGNALENDCNKAFLLNPYYSVMDHIEKIVSKES